MADCDDNGLILRVGRLEDLESKHPVIASMRKAYEVGSRPDIKFSDRAGRFGSAA
ncbi:hypothetical protein PHLCEN_2v11374 [Hermanssonia centrifuga]|uniref:Uncharacterized protein n=1 Tax=Hermanssonia centrifuga TaxID=98765 RepID=A0A2R6NK42_9APHY|nr:hypothetical protein PHLCEN_2v11374 [Hermanssonia centrifuga]